jgi:ABC-type transporter Mla MlaB component
MAEQQEGETRMKLLGKKWNTEPFMILFREAPRVELVGELTLGEPTRSLRGYVQELLARRRYHVELDFRYVTRIDPAALGLLVYLKALADMCHAQICIQNLRVKDLRVIVKLATVFNLDRA